MEETNQNQKPATLYVAPNCGLQIHYDAFAYNAEFGLEYTVQNIHDFPLSAKPKEMRGWLSPMRDVTLPLDVKLSVGIPGNAAKFSYVYPPLGLADYIDWQKVSSTAGKTSIGNKWALPYVASFGAYAYFDNENVLLGVNAISLKQTEYELVFEGPFIATNEAYREVNDLNRYQSLYLDVLGEVGFIGSAWMDPGDSKFIDNTVKGQEDVKNHHGGFLYFRHDKSAVIFLIDADDSLSTPSHGIASLIFDALRLCKQQLRRSSLSTTCPSKNQMKDKIHRACQDGSVVGVRHLLDEHLMTNNKILLHRDNFGWTPLHYACCYNAQDKELIALLLKKCPEAIHVKNNNDLLPIHLACHNNPSLDVIKMLVEYDESKKSIQMKSKHHGLLPLHYACSNSSTSIEVIRYLILNDGINYLTIEGKSRVGWTSIHMAIAGNHCNSVLQMLFQILSESSNRSGPPLIQARMNDLLPIQLACLKGCSADIVSTLLEADAESETFYDIVQDCYEYNLQNSSILHIALSNAPCDVIDLLLMKEVKARCMPSRKPIDLLQIHETYDGRLPMHVAATRKDLKVETFRTLLGLNKLSVFEEDIDGNTPLHLICMNEEVDERLIQSFLDAANENLRDHKGHMRASKPLPRIYNKRKRTPLYLAVESRAKAAHVLLSPEYICLKGMDHKAKSNLLSLVLEDTMIQKKLVKNLAERQYFALIMLELVANVCATSVYFNASNNLMVWNQPISPIETILLVSCITIFILRELLQLKGSTLAEYLSDGWNWIENSSIFMLIAATYHMIELRAYDDMEPKRNLFIWSGVLLLLQFIFIIRTTFLPFARFVAGLMAIFWTLIPFFVVSLMCLLAFTYSFLMSGGRVEECPDFGNCLMWTLQGFFFGMDDFQKTPILDVIFGIVGVVVL